MTKKNTVTIRFHQLGGQLTLFFSKRQPSPSPRCHHPTLPYRLQNTGKSLYHLIYVPVDWDFKLSFRAPPYPFKNTLMGRGVKRHTEDKYVTPLYLHTVHVIENGTVIKLPGNPIYTPVTWAILNNN